MGLNLGVSAMTSGGLILTTLFLAIMGILLVTASNKVKESPNSEDEDLKKIDNNLVTSYILIWIAAGVTLLLAIAYGGQESAWNLPEWIHAILGFGVIVLLVIGIIYAYIALNELNTPEISDAKNNADAYIWASLVLGVFTFIGLIITGSGRITYNVVKGESTKRVLDAEQKIHETHSKVTGKPMTLTHLKSPTASPLSSCPTPLQ